MSLKPSAVPEIFADQAANLAQRLMGRCDLDSDISTLRTSELEDVIRCLLWTARLLEREDGTCGPTPWGRCMALQQRDACYSARERQVVQALGAQFALDPVGLLTSILNPASEAP